MVENRVDLNGWRLEALALAAVLSAGLVGGACGKGVKVVEMGESTEVGGVEISVGGYEIRHLELVEGSKTHEYDEPVLAIPLSLKNTGKEGFRYVPTHETQQMTESTTPLLYYDPGEKASLPPDDKSPVNGVYLEEGSLEEQVTEETVIDAGSSLRDVLLFEVPSEQQADLILSVPPAYHRGDRPVLFRIPYQYEEPSSEGPRGVGDTVELEGVGFTVQSVETAYIELEETRDGKAYSSSPLLKVAFRIENTGDEAVEYAPKHQDDSVYRTPLLTSGEETYRPVEFPLNPTVKGQVQGSETIESGKTLEDFVVFQRPGNEVESLTFEYPAARFDRGGVLEFELPYEYDDPDKPDEIAEDDDEKGEEE